MNTDEFLMMDEEGNEITLIYPWKEDERLIEGGLVEGESYRIWYDEPTKIIIEVEKPE
jgi:hypothetical protein